LAVDPQDVIFFVAEQLRLLRQPTVVTSATYIEQCHRQIYGLSIESSNPKIIYGALAKGDVTASQDGGEIMNHQSFWGPI
jgi:hypothetical protein